MSYLKRWTSGVLSRVDAFVTRIENHESLVNEALKDLRESAARARVQLKRVREDGRRLEEKCAEQREQATRWRERANSSLEDEARAMECLRREKIAQHTLRALEKRLAAHAQIEKQLVADVRTLDDRLSRLEEQRNLMRTRQSRAEALGVLQGSTVQLTDDIEDVFDRWEIQVSQAESMADVTSCPEDAFESAFLDEEEQDDLRLELESLRRSSHESR